MGLDAGPHLALEARRRLGWRRHVDEPQRGAHVLVGELARAAPRQVIAHPLAVGRVELAVVVEDEVFLRDVFQC